MTDDENKKLPSARADAQKAKEKQEQEFADKRLAMLREDFGRTFQTEHGMRVLAWIMERSGFGKVILSATNDGNLDPNKTLYSAMELNNYLAIRQHISMEVLARIEYGEIKPSGFFDPNDEPSRKTSKSKSKQKGL